MEATTPRFPKRCACSLSWTIDAWLGLPWAGFMDDGDDRIDLRRCTCQSTIGMPTAVVLDAAPEAPARIIEYR